MSRCYCFPLSNFALIKSIALTRRLSILLLTILAFLTCSVERSSAQNAFRNLDVVVSGQAAPGYYLISQVSLDSFGLMDNAGRYQHATNVGRHGNTSAYKGKWISYYVESTGKQVYVRRDVNLNVIDTMQVSAPYVTDFHEGRIVSDSSYYILGTELIEADMSTLVTGGKKNASVISGVIQERTFSGKTLFTWRSIEHIPVTDACKGVDLAANTIDYIHINSIVEDVDRNILISCRHLSEVIKINRETGAIMWRLGGSESKNNQFRFLNDTTDGYVGFSYQHCAVPSASGTLLLFDNGNTKNSVKSRAVEYQLDYADMTAKRVWEFVPKPDIYASTMGSVQELENGNILIGYGSGSNKVVAQEVSREGTIEVQINNPTNIGFSSYRVGKATFLMTGVYKSITSPSYVAFSNADSTTHVSVNLTLVDAPTSAVVQRYPYAPHSVTFSSQPVCGVLPTRWVVNFKENSNVDGSLEFNLGTCPGIEYPDFIRMYRRPTEGTGAFTRVNNAMYSASTKVLAVPGLVNGEYMIAYADCFAPQLISPTNLSVEVSSSPVIAWSTAIGEGEYKVEMALDETFSSIVSSYVTRRLDTTLSALSKSTTYYWRVRTTTVSGNGPWSVVHRFTTQIGIPQIVYPRNTSDTVSVLSSAEFSWTSAPGADAYRVRILRRDVAELIVDTIVATTTFLPSVQLIANTWYSWTVSSVKGTVTRGSSGTEAFLTALAAPGLEKPSYDAIDVATVKLGFLWTPISSALKYVVTIRKGDGGATLFQDTVNTNTILVAMLPAATRLTWSCYAIGMYGRGESAPPMDFITASASSISQPVRLSPNSVASIDTLNVTFSWSAPSQAKSYDLQISSSGSFSWRDLVISDLKEPTYTIATLKPGWVYKWRAITYADNSVSGWSDTATFTTVPRSGSGLTPLLPMPGSVSVPLAGNFAYIASSAYTRYRLLVDTLPEFKTPIQFSSTSNTCKYDGLLPATTYFWKVVGSTSTGKDVEGATAFFVTKDAITGIDEELDAQLFSATLVGNQIVIRSARQTSAKLSVGVYTLQGRLLYSGNVQVTSDAIALNEPLHTGVYFVLLRDSNGKYYATRLAVE